jgi:acyl-coenzyme A synthetase/AMP-(fatty) acid ligase
MVPEAVEFRNELPRTSSGKVDRRALLDPNAVKEAR